MRKAKGPKNKNFVTHLMTMPQAAGKNTKSALIQRRIGSELYWSLAIPIGVLLVGDTSPESRY